MILKILCVIIALFLVYFAVASFLIACAEKKERHKIEKEKKENEQKTADIITEANKTKAEARTGDHSRDINYMADKLHDYANK